MFMFSFFASGTNFKDMTFQIYLKSFGVEVISQLNEDLLKKSNKLY